MKRNKDARDAAHNITLIEFILDQTGSMTTCKEETILGFNDFLKDQKSQDGACLLTLTKFDASRNKTTPYADLDINMVPDMRPEWFLPDGNTNLRDTIGDRIDHLEERLEKWATQPKVLIVVMTDGEDNASKIYTEKQIHSKIKTKKSDGWVFVYLGIDQNALAIAEKLGFDEGNIQSFARENLKKSVQIFSKATTVFRASASSSEPFFNQTI